MMRPQRFERSVWMLLILLGSLVIMGCSISWFDAFRLSYVNLQKWENLINSPSPAEEYPPTDITVENTAVPDESSEQSIQEDPSGPDEGPAVELVTARGSFQLDTQIVTDPLGGGTRELEGPIELSFNPKGGPVTGNGSLVYEAWSKGCAPARFEHTAKFTGTSFPDGTAKGTVEVINLVNRVSNCVYDSLEVKISPAWEAHFGNGIFEGQVINNDGTTLPFKLTY